MKLGSLFDGIGGFPLAGSRHGIEPVWASEIEPFPIKVTSIRFPAMKHLGDITKIDGSAIEPVDIITFGSPCQDLSVAGKRAGLQHTDKGDETTTRSGLFMEAVRIIKQMREATRDGMGTAKPRWAVWENVPGAYSSNSGEDFRVVLEELARVSETDFDVPHARKWHQAGAIVGDGWSIAWRTFDAQYWGVPQRRRRIYLVCDFAGGCAPEVLFEREGLRRHTATGGEAREGIAADASGCAGGPVWNESGKGYWMPGFGCLRAEGENRPSRPGHVIGAGGRVGDAQGRAGETVAFGVGESPDVAHCLRAGASKADKHESTTYVCIPINDQATHINGGCNGSMVGAEGDPMYTVTAQDRHAIALYENHGQDSRLTGPLDVSPTVAAKFGTGGNNTPLVEHRLYESHPMDSRITGPVEVSQTVSCKFHKGAADTPLVVENFRKSRRAQSADDAETWVPDAVANTVNCFDVGDVRTTSVVMAHGQANAEVVADGCPALTCNHEQPILFHSRMRVRRLTPLECERLQGFPDGWTDIPGASDSGRYKALGNSLAIPTAEYVIEGIAE